MAPVFSMVTRCYVLGISVVAYALLMGHWSGAGDVATGCWTDINVTGQRKRTRLRLRMKPCSSLGRHRFPVAFWFY